MSLSPGVRNLISRGTLVLVAVALLWAGVRTFQYGSHLQREHVRQFGPPTPEKRDFSGASYFWLLGVVLVGAGGVALAGGLLPVSLLEQAVTPPRTFDDDLPDR